MTILVLDPNVFVSAALTPEGAPGRLIALLADGAFEAVVCPLLMEEVAGTMARPKIARRVSADDARAYLTAIRRFSINRSDPSKSPRVCRDRHDDYLFGLALEASAHAIVSGDKDVQQVQDPPIPVYTPREALSRLEGLGRY